MKAAESRAMARLWCLDNDDWSIEFQHNPEWDSMNLTRSVTWQPLPDAGGFDPWGGPLEYEQGGADTLTFTVMFDQSAIAPPDLADAEAFQAALLAAVNGQFGLDPNEESVLPDLQKLYRLTAPIEPANFSTTLQVRPPVVAFVWEAFEFMGAITNLEVSFKLMDATGKPKRATVAITIQGRAFSGGVTLEDFEGAEYDPPAQTGTGDRANEDERDNLLDLL